MKEEKSFYERCRKFITATEREITSQKGFMFEDLYGNSEIKKNLFVL